MKNSLLFFLCFVLSSLSVFANSPIVQTNQRQTIKSPQIAQPRPVSQINTQPKPKVVSTSFENCVKTYPTSVENLFYLTLAAINNANYEIDEIQSRTGYISFLSGQKPFLVSITSINDNSSMIKITPMDNSYNFSPLVLDKIFVYLTNNIK